MSITAETGSNLASGLLPSNLDRAAFSTPGGHSVEFWIRPNTSDWNMCNASSGEHDEYGIPIAESGFMLDIGASMGSVTIPLIADNPEAHIVAVEPLPENVALIRANLALNGFEDRCTVILGAASSGRAKVRIGYGEVTDPTLIHEFIGNEFAPAGSREVRAKPYSLRRLVPEGEIVFVKIDCEGCEYSLFNDPEISRIRLITGEVHFGWKRLEDLLSPTHDLSGEGKDFGYFRAVRR